MKPLNTNKCPFCGAEVLKSERGTGQRVTFRESPGRCWWSHGSCYESAKGRKVVQSMIACHSGWPHREDARTQTLDEELLRQAMMLAERLDLELRRSGFKGSGHKGYTVLESLNPLLHDNLDLRKWRPKKLLTQASLPEVVAFLQRLVSLRRQPSGPRRTTAPGG